MRRFSLCLAVAVAALAYAGSKASAEPCTVGLNVHNHARIMFKHKTLTQCMAGAAGCKCVSCWNADHSVSAMCFALVIPAPGK